MVLDDFILILAYEYGYRIDQIQDMPYYQFDFLVSNYSSIFSYKINIIGSGNGLVKKPKILKSRQKENIR